MDKIITPDGIYGKIESISSKSDFLRVLMCSLFSNKPTKIIFNNMCDDIKAGILAVKSLGMKVEYINNGVILYPRCSVKQYAEVNCGESGALLRFLLPCANYFCNNVRFVGENSLASRPINSFIKLLSEHGLIFSNSKIPFQVSGSIRSGDYFISGNISSQFISGLLFILPILKGNSRIIITTKLQSEQYVDLTVQRLSDFGISVEKRGREILIPGNQSYNSRGIYIVEGDWSYAATNLCLGAVSGEVSMCGLNMNSIQPDKKIIDIFCDMGINIKFNGTEVLVKKSIPRGITADLSGCPDLFPVLAALLSCADGKTIFYGTERLVYKESNRLYSVSSMLNSLGANIRYSKNSVEINPVKRLYGGVVNSFGDHRVAMAATIAAKLCNKSVKIMGANCVEKSASNFFKVIDACTRRN